MINHNTNSLFEATHGFYLLQLFKNVLISNICIKQDIPYPFFGGGEIMCTVSGISLEADTFLAHGTGLASYLSSDQSSVM